MAFKYDDEIAVLQEAGLHEEMFIGDGLPKSWEATLCGVCGPDSEGDTPDRTGDHTPLPATLDIGVLSSGGDSRSGTCTPPQLEMLQRLLGVHLKLEDLPSVPSDCSQPKSQTALTLDLGADWRSTADQVLPLVLSTSPDPAATGTIKPPSLGSRGHPDRCAAACKFVKRKGGCRIGADCELCHICFWQRSSSAAHQTKRDLSPSAAESEILPAEAEDHRQASDNGWSSRGSRNHPSGCAPACKHFWRKKGCRKGAKCPNCHECRWKRAQDEVKSFAGLGLMTTGYSSDASEVLQKLLHMQIERAASKPDNVDSKGSLGRDADQEPLKLSLADNIWVPEDIASFPYSEVSQREVPPKVMRDEISQDPLPDAVPSIGTMGHPFTCKLPCKYNVKRSGCKDGMRCSRCHLCHWSRMAARSASKSLHVLSF